VRDGATKRTTRCAKKSHSTIMILFGSGKRHPQTAARVPRDVAHGRILAGIDTR